MYNALRSAATGMMSAQTQTDVLAHNIANSQTAGYKEKIALFATLGSIEKERPGTFSSASGTILPVGVQVGTGVKVAGVTTNLGQGTGVNSANPNHLLIQGNGYFQIEMPSGEIAYTRAGTFERSATGQLVTLEGFTVLPGIVVPENAVSFSVNASGEAFAKIAGQVALQPLGQIELASFVNPGGLETIESNLLLETPSSGAPIIGVPGAAGFGRVLQNWFEASNVSSVLSVTELIEAQRLFEFNTKVVKAAEEMSRAETNVLV